MQAGIINISSWPARNPVAEHCDFSPNAKTDCFCDAHDEQRAGDFLCNGTHWHKPTTLLISLDACRHDYITPDYAPFLSALKLNGTSAPKLRPSFPPVTFPQHHTLATGLYPQEHGIVGNSFFAPDLDMAYSSADPTINGKGGFFSKEPLWSTAVRQGIRTTVRMYPTSENDAGFAKPRIIPFDGSKATVDRYHVDDILGELDKPFRERPQLIMDYANPIDTNGHAHGAEGQHAKDAVARMDAMVRAVWEGLTARHLQDIVTLVVVSDHGMATIDQKCVLQLEDYVDPKHIESVHGAPIVNIRSKPGRANHEAVMSQLAASEAYKTKRFNFFNASTVTADFHYSSLKNPRISDITAYTVPGCVMVTHPENAKQMREQTGYPLKGIHGHDINSPEIGAIFLMAGRNVERGRVVKPFGT